jgi:hypothetical protein
MHRVYLRPPRGVLESVTRITQLTYQASIVSRRTRTVTTIARIPIALQA